MRQRKTKPQKHRDIERHGAKEQILRQRKKEKKRDRIENIVPVCWWSVGWRREWFEAPPTR